MQRSLRRPGAVQAYACQIVRSYAAEGKVCLTIRRSIANAIMQSGMSFQMASARPTDDAADHDMVSMLHLQGSGRYPHLQEPGKSAKSSVESTPGNHAYPPTGGVEASNSSKTSSASKPSESATAANPGNHAYPPTAGASSGTKPPSATQSAAKPASESTKSKSSGSSSAYASQGKDTKASQAGSPTDRPTPARSPGSEGQGQPKGPPAYKPIGAAAPQNAKDAVSDPSSSTPSPSAAASQGQGQPKGPPAYKPIGAAAPQNAKDAVSGPSPSTPSSSAPAGQGQGQPKGPPAYKPIGASAPLNAEGPSSSKSTPATAGMLWSALMLLLASCHFLHTCPCSCTPLPCLTLTARTCICCDGHACIDR